MATGVFTFLLAGFLVSCCTASPAPVPQGFNSGIPGGTGGLSGSQFQPFGSSDRGCAALLNETLAQYEYRVIPERILITAETSGNSFSGSSSGGLGNQQLDTWANQVCGDMNNAIGYLNSACKYISGSTFQNQQEVVAQKKVAAMGAIRDYLCTINNQFNPTNLKEMAINSGATCARNMEDSNLCNDIQMSSSGGQFISMLPNSAITNVRRMLKYGTLIILSMQYYNQEECKYLMDITNCIQNKLNSGGGACGFRAASHYSRIYDMALQGVQCSAGGFSTYNSYNGGLNQGMGMNNNFNRFPNSNNGFNSGGFGSNSGSNWNSQSGSSGWPNSGSGNSWNSQSGSNWPNSGSNSWNSQSGSNWPNSGSSSWSSSQSGSSWPNNQYGSSGYDSSNQWGTGLSGSSWDNYGSSGLRPYTYRRNSGTAVQSIMAMIVTLALAALAL